MRVVRLDASARRASTPHLSTCGSMQFGCFCSIRRRRVAGRTHSDDCRERRDEADRAVVRSTRFRASRLLTAAAESHPRRIDCEWCNSLSAQRLRDWRRNAIVPRTATQPIMRLRSLISRRQDASAGDPLGDARRVRPALVVMRATRRTERRLPGAKVRDMRTRALSSSSPSANLVGRSDVWSDQLEGYLRQFA